MTETALGAVMGYELRAWQRKEAISDDLSQYNKTSLRPGEYKHADADRRRASMITA